MSRNLTYQETEEEFLVRMMRNDDEHIMMLIRSGIAEPGILLTYPKNYNFISRLSKIDTSRIIKHGWNIDKTIFLEIPHVVTFYHTFVPSLVNYWPICVPSKKAMFRCLAFTRGYVPTAHSIELEDSVTHESLHLKHEEPVYLKGGSRPSDYDENEKKIENMVKETMYSKYGSKINEIEKKSFFNAYKMQKRLKTLFSGVLEYWLSLYFIENFPEYKDVSLHLNENLTDDAYITDVQAIQEEVSMKYNEIFGFKIKPLITS